MVASKIAKVISILQRLKAFYPQRILLAIYNSLIIPHFNYCILSWGASIKLVERLQKRALRVISYSKRISHTEPICAQFQLLKVQDIYKISILKFYYNLCNNKLPVYFEVFNELRKQHNVRYYVRNCKLSIPKISHEFARKGLRYQFVINVNNTNDSVLGRTHTHSYSSLHNHAKCYFLSSYNSDCSITNCFRCMCVHAYLYVYLLNVLCMSLFIMTCVY
jgi:hypothetical protein